MQFYLKVTSRASRIAEEIDSKDKRNLLNNAAARGGAKLAEAYSIAQKLMCIASQWHSQVNSEAGQSESDATRAVDQLRKLQEDAKKWSTKWGDWGKWFASESCGPWIVLGIFEFTDNLNMTMFRSKAFLQSCLTFAVEVLWLPWYLLLQREWARLRNRTNDHLMKIISTVM